VTPLSVADRDLIADLAAVLDLYEPTNASHIKRKRDALLRARVRLAERPKRQRRDWRKWIFCK